MIKHVLRVTRWELSKLRRRRMTWISLAFIVLVSQHALWDSYIQYRHAGIGRVDIPVGPEAADGNQPTISISCLDIRDGEVESRLTGLETEHRGPVLKEIETLKKRCPEILRKYELVRARFNENAIVPNCLSNSMVVFSWVGYVFVMILAALSMGEEYSWGTARQILARGCGRGRFLAIKFVSLTAATAFGHMVVLTVAGIGSIVLSITLTDTGIVTDAVPWFKVLISFCKSIYAMLPFIMLGIFFAVLFYSASSGVVFVILFFLVELFLRWIVFLNAGHDAAGFFLSASTTEWMKALEFPAFDSPSAVTAFLEFYLDPFLVILTYLVGFAGTTFWLFQRRDLQSSPGS